MSEPRVTAEDREKGVSRVSVSADEVAAAKLQIKVLEQLGRPVDDRLRALAACGPSCTAPASTPPDSLTE